MGKKLLKKICTVTALLLVLTTVSASADPGAGYDAGTAEVQSAETAVQSAGSTGQARTAGKQLVYTEAAKPNANTSGDGSKTNPYNRFKDALANVADGGTIYIIGSGAFINVEDEGGTLPFVIDKNVTVRAEGSGQGTLTVRAAGLILNGDVTFENVELGFVNKYHSAIFASGHNLVLKNVSRESGSRLVHIFAGGLQYNGNWVGTVPKAGGSITVSGERTHLGNIYAGSMNAGHTGDVSISVEGANRMTIGDVYACGAHEPYINLGNWFDISEPPDPDCDENLTLSGDAEITLVNTPVRTVFGLGAQGGTTLNFSTEYFNSHISLTGIKNLTVKSGELAPFVLTSSDEDSSFGTIAVEEGASLDISENEDIVTAEIFRGGGTLILGRNKAFTATKELTGSTVFKTSGGAGGRSGFVIGGHAYINAPADSTGEFTFTPDVLQDGSTIKSEISGANKIWNIELADDSAAVIRSMSCAQPENTLYKSEAENFEAEFTVNIEKDSPRFPAFEYEVKFNGENYEVKKSTGGSESAIAEELNLEIYMTDSGNSAAAENEYALCVYPITHGVNVSEIKSGFYEITVKANSADGEIPLTVYLTVLPDLTEPDETKKDSTVTLDPLTDTLVFGENAELKASVSDKDGAGAVDSAAVKYYVNGTYAGESASGEACSTEISAANGFRAGDNTVIAVFEGSGTHNASSSESVTVTVNKTDPDISVKLNGGVTAVYDGQAHAVSEDMVSVKVPGAPAVKVPYSIVYKDEAGNRIVGEPVNTGKYSVIIAAEETEYSKAGELTEPDAVIIEKAQPVIKLTQQKDGDGNTEIVVTVSGAAGGVKPVGEVTLLRGGEAVDAAKNLSFGQAVFSLGKWTGTALFKAEYSTGKVEKPRYSDASAEVTMTVTESSGGGSGTGGSGSGGTGGSGGSGGGSGGSGGSSGGAGGAAAGTEDDNSGAIGTSGAAVKSASEMFTDVEKGSWYESAVSFAVNNGLFKGISENRFDPAGSTSRAMIVTVLARMNGQDVDNASPWYAKSVEWAVNAGISDGSAPNASITREQLVTMLYRFAGSPDLQEAADLTIFADGREVSPWAEDAMKWAAAQGIIKGDSSMRIMPSSNASRAEAAAVFERFSKVVSEK